MSGTKGITIVENVHSDMSLEAVDSSVESEAQTDSFTTLDYVRELYLNSEEQKKTGLKKLRLLRAGVVFLGITMACVVLSAALVVPALMNTANEAAKALAIVQKIDIETIAEDMDALALQANDTFAQVGDAVKKLNDLDIESLNETIVEMGSAVESISQLDIATLNKAIANLNATIEPFARFFGVK